MTRDTKFYQQCESCTFQRAIGICDSMQECGKQCKNFCEDKSLLVPCYCLQDAKENEESCPHYEE